MTTAVPPSSPQPKPGLRFLAPLVLITASGPVSMQMILPALPAIGDHFGVGPAMTHLLVSLALIAFGGAMLVWGPLSDRYGRKPPMLLGIACFAIGGVMCWLAPTIEILIAGRVLGAAGAAAGMVLTRAMVRDVYPPKDVPGAMSQLTVGQIVPPMLAPVLGGLLTQTLGWHWNFSVLVVVGVVALILVIRLPETHHNHHGGAIMRAMVGSFNHLFRMPLFRAYVLFGGLTMSGYFAFLAGAPDVAINIMGMTPASYGMAYVALSISFMAGNMVSARLSARWGINRMIVSGSAISTLGAVGGVIALLLIAAALSPWTLFIAGSLLAFGNGISLNNSQAGAMAVSPEHAGAAAGLAGFMQMAFGALTTQGLGLVQNGTVWPLFITMAVAASAGLIIFTLRRQ
jgi:DHA1 family bicyclomycin/chloramphenicol resistance-like MFS transporter